VAAERELGVDLELERDELQILEPRELAARRDVVGDVRDGTAVPELDRALERSRGGLGPTRVKLAPPPLEQLLETQRVDALRVDLDDIARRERRDHVRAKPLPELRDVPLDRRPSRLGRHPGPEVVEQPVCRDDGVRAEEQQGEHRPLTRRAERNGHAGDTRLEGPQDPELDAAVHRLRQDRNTLPAERKALATDSTVQPREPASRLQTRTYVLYCRRWLVA
jgi:hypothetical protein